MTASNFHAVARVWSRLLTTNVEFYRAINVGNCDLCDRVFVIRLFCWSGSCCRQCSRILEPCRLQIFKQALSAAFTTVSAFAVTTKAAGSIKQIRAIDPDDASF